MEALQGQDALVITLSVMAPKDQQAKLITAAADANVPWVFPNEWAPDTADEALSKGMLTGEAMKAHRELISKLGKSSWIAVSTGFWYEWSLAISVAFGFDFANRAVTIFDEGETRISTSTWPQVGRAVAGLLSLKIHAEGEDYKEACLDRFKDGWVYIKSFTLSQKEMLDSVLRVTGTVIGDWKVTHEPIQERYAAGIEQMQAGDRKGFAKALYSRVFFPDGCGDVEKSRGVQNEVLGLPSEDLDYYTGIAIERSKVSEWN